jgi:hypothetical protein
MTVTCQTCTAPVGDQASLCGSCTNQLRATLDSVADLAAELDTTITRQAVLGVRGGPRAAEKPLPFHVQASEAAWVLRNTLGGWARVIAEEAIPGAAHRLETINGPSGYPTSPETITTAQIAVWLAAHLEQLRHHPAAGEAHDEIRGAAQAAGRAIDHPRTRHTFPVGPCPDCSAHLTAYIRRDEPPVITCGGEQRHTYAAHQWARVGTRIMASESA